MEKTKLFSEKRKIVVFLSGLLAVLVTFFPSLLLGENAIFTYHDQLDGEVIAYLLQAKHLFSGNTLPEFLGGVSKTALTMPAPGSVLFFLGGNALFGLTAMAIMGKAFGYWGMYLLAKDVTGSQVAAVISGVLFGWLPFLPVYGLSQFGVPLLVWSAMQLYRKKHLPWAYLYIAFFALNSSLVLVGFGLLGMGILMWVWCFRKQRAAVLRCFGGWLMLLGIYVAENFRLLSELLGIGGKTVSHKTEYVLSADSFLGRFFAYLTSGGQHSEDYHLLPVLFTAILVLLCLAKRVPIEKKLRRAMGICLGWNVVFALVGALWDSGAGVWLRENLSVLGSFQLDRLLWIAPCFWYLLFACGLVLGIRFCQACPATVGRLAALCGGMVILFFGAQILLAGDVKSNLQKLRNPDYGVLSLQEYYAIGVMNQVEDFLRETTGQEPEEYRVVSLGVDPAAALYQGFYCLDGYSNNYSLEYKHAFREVLEPELSRSDYLREYFDNWGNRCYLFGAECPGYYTIEKHGFYFQDYQLNTEALAALGGRYLFSAAYIANAEEQGLTLLREAPFETENSYYAVFVYAIEP